MSSKKLCLAVSTYIQQKTLFPRRILAYSDFLGQTSVICVKGRHKLYVEYHKRIFAEINKLLFVDVVCSIDEEAGKLTGKYQQEEEAIRFSQNIP
jgi:hypothetical protein